MERNLTADTISGQRIKEIIRQNAGKGTGNQDGEDNVINVYSRDHCHDVLPN